MQVSVHMLNYPFNDEDYYFLFHSEIQSPHIFLHGKDINFVIFI